MRKIIEVSSDTNIGGAGKVLLNFLEEYDRSEYDVLVVLPKDSLLKPHVEVLGVQIIEIDASKDKSFDISAIKKFITIFKNERPDLVHTHASMSARIAAKICGINIVYTRHSVFDPPDKISKGIGKIINGAVNNFLADGIIAVAEAAKDNLVKTGVDETKITVILNGVKGLKALDESEKDEVRKRFGVYDDSLIISIVARLEDIKGHDYFIDAANILLKSGVRAKFLIAGTGSYEEHLKQKVRDMGLERDIIFTGFIKDVPSLMNVTYIQCNASFGTEATSLALLEGMSLGIPAVVSDFGGNPGVISTGQNGFLVKKKNAEDLANGIKKLLCDKELYSKMQKNSIKIFNTKFTSKAMTKQTEEYYNRIINRE